MFLEQCLPQPRILLGNHPLVVRIGNLGVHGDLPHAGEIDDEVGSSPGIPTGLFDEITVLGHSGGFADVAQGKLSPLAAALARSA